MTAVEMVDDLETFEACEAIIEHGAGIFMRVGRALMMIKDRGWHREAGYASLDDYCERRWGFGRRQGERLVAAAQTMGELTEVDEEVAPIGADDDATNWSHLPSNEAQVRPLTSLPTPEAKKDAWNEAIESAEGEGRKPTAKDVAAAVDRIRSAKRAEQSEEDARLDEELERRGIQKATPEEAAATKKAARSLGSIRSSVGRVLETIEGMTPAEFTDAYRRVGIYSVHNLPVDDIEHVGQWLTDLAGGIRHESR